MNSRQQRDLEKMSDPATWPGQRLCLKRYFPDRQIEFADLLLGSDGVFNFIPLDRGGRRKGHKEMLSRLVEEGWLVD